jgi:hypothetical protein
MMGQWLDLFRALTNSGIGGQTGRASPRQANQGVNDLPPLGAERRDDPGVNDSMTPKPVCHDTAPSVRGSIPLVFDAGRNGARYPTVPSSIEAPEVAYDAALTVFCDFETRNTGGCDLTTAGAWRYAADPALPDDRVDQGRGRSPAAGRSWRG